MTALPFEVNNRYIAILRCRTWCNWPEFCRYVSKGYREPVHLSNGAPVRLSVHIVTYAQRTRPELEPAHPLDPTCGPILWRGHMDSGYWLGTNFIKAPEDDVPVTFHYEPPYEGDIDIQLHMGLESAAPIDELRQLAREISLSMLAYVNVCFGELAAPVAPIQVRELKEGQSHFDSSVVMAVRERQTIGPDLAHTAPDQFVQVRSTLSAVEARALAVTSRRYLTSLTEVDDVDRYCDLWESCEFSTMFEKAKGQKVGKVAHALASHLTRSGVSINKAQIERELRIKDLYETRGHIVHDAVEAPEDFGRITAMLEAIATELLRYRFGLPCLYRGPIADRLASRFASRKESKGPEESKGPN